MPVLLHDIVEVLAATAVMPLLLFLPGYAIASLLFARKVESQQRIITCAWAVVLSFATMPVLVYLAALCGSLVFPAVLVLTLDVIGLRQLFHAGHLRIHAKTLGWMSIWLLFVLIETIDLPWRGHLYVSGMVLDHSYRVAFIQTIATHGIPPPNPLFFPGGPQPLRYYYFWYALCALPVRFLHLEPRAVLIASCFAAGVALVSIVWLYMESLFAGRGKRIAAALLAITGLDVLVVIANTATGVPLDIDPEWWSHDQVTSWMDTVLWVPHHTAALVAALTALLLLWRTPATQGSRRSWPMIVLAGLGIASTFGLSVYIGITLVLLVGMWSLWLLKEGDRTKALPMAVALMISALAAFPLLRELSGRVGSGGGFPITFGIREMVNVSLFTGMLPSSLQAHPQITSTVLRLILLPVGYFVEFGAFGVAFVIAWMQNRRSPAAPGSPRRNLLFLTFASLLISTCIRSTAIQNNDFGYRSVLLTQFFLLLFTADVIAQWRSRGGKWNLRSGLLAAMLAVGLLSSVFQIAVLRLFSFRSPHSAEIALDLREGYQRLQTIATPTDVIGWPVPPPLSDRLQNERILHALHLLYAGHQTVATDDDCGAPFGGNPALCGDLQRDLRRLDRGIDKTAAVNICNQWGIRYLVATESEPVWTQKEAWPWTLPPVVRLPHMQVVTCGETKLP